MSLNDRKLDPVTADFVDESRGAFEQCDSVENKVAFSYLIPVGSWEGDPALGHRFDELANATDTQANRNLLRDFARQAVQWLIDGGELDRVEVIVERLKPSAVAFQVDYYLPGKAQPRRVSLLVPVGAG
jgi:phage gp46-like protein